MILTRAGQARQEVELTPPEEARSVSEGLPITESSQRAELPAAVCPDGSPQTPLSQEGMEEPLPPGVSPLDEQFPLSAMDSTDSADIVTAELVELLHEEVSHDE